jgi:hypothetical protein
MFEHEIEQPIYVDRSARGFSHILCLARTNNDSKYKFPIKYRDELDFFLIDYKENDLYDFHGSLQSFLEIKINEMKSLCAPGPPGPRGPR